MEFILGSDKLFRDFRFETSGLKQKLLLFAYSGSESGSDG